MTSFAEHLVQLMEAAEDNAAVPTEVAERIDGLSVWLSRKSSCAIEQGYRHDLHPPAMLGEGWVHIRSCTPDDGSKTEDELLAESIEGGVTYQQCIESAAAIVSEHGENSEYDRGMYELIAGLFGIEGYPTYERSTVVAADVRALAPVNPA